LDVGSSAIRLCELTRTKTGYQLTKYHQRELTIDPAADDETKRRVRADALKQLLKETKSRAKKAVMAVPGQSVFTRPRPLPPVPEHKVTQIVRYEIQQQIPFSLDQIALDYQVLDRTEGQGYYVLMAAIKVDIVERSLDILRDVKKSIDIVDVCPLAAYNWFKHSGEFGEQGECVALIDLGASTTDIVIERENRFQWNRPLSLGGNEITRALADEFGLSFEEAERIKRERGFAPTGDPQRDGRAGEVIGRVLSRLVTEITRSFAYYRSQPGGGPVSRVIVTGGGACLRNMIPYLQRQLGLEVRIAQPLAGLAVGPGAQEVNEHPEQAAVVLGLALRCCETVPIEINLIPPRVLEGARRKEQIFYWALSVATVVLIVLSMIPAKAHENENVLENIEILKTAIQKYDPKLGPSLQSGNVSGVRSEYEAKLAEAKKTVSGYQNLVKALDNAYSARVVWLTYLNAVNEARPKERNKSVWISSIETTMIGQPSARAAGGTPRYATDARLAAREELDVEYMESEEDDSYNPFSSGISAFAGNVGRTGAASGLSPFSSSGFQGIGSGAQVGAGMGTGSREELGSGGMTPAMMGRVGRGPGSAEVDRPNGLVILGYASDDDTVSMFKQRLIDSGLFVEGGVYLDEQFVQKVPVTALDNAEVGITMRRASGAMSMGGGSGGLGSLGEDEEEDRREGQRGFRLGGSRRRTSALGGGGPLILADLMPSIISFRVDVQFAGKAVDLTTVSRTRTTLESGAERRRQRRRERRD